MYIFFYDRLFYFLDSIATIDIELENDSRKRDLTTSQQKVDVEMGLRLPIPVDIYIFVEKRVSWWTWGAQVLGFPEKEKMILYFPFVRETNIIDTNTITVKQIKRDGDKKNDVHLGIGWSRILRFQYGSSLTADNRFTCVSCYAHQATKLSIIIWSCNIIIAINRTSRTVNVKS